MKKFVLTISIFCIAILGYSQNEGSSKLVGDVNGDGKVNVTDISYLTDLVLNNKIIFENVVHDTIYVEDGHGYVDLGLSVRWATTNIGAEESYDYGKYYAWGETTAYGETPGPYSTAWSGSTNSNYLSLDKKTEYSFKYYKWGTNFLNMFKYNSSDGLYILENEDDAASVIWGGAWRMPTDGEFTELRTKCKWEWTTLNGVNGYKVVGPNGKSIFLPAAGRRSINETESIGIMGEYYTSNLNTTYSYTCDAIFFYSTIVSRETNVSRYNGLTIRPVLPKK